MSGWHASLVEDFANLEFLDPLDGLIENVLEITCVFLLPCEELLNVVFSALLHLSESLLGGFSENFNAPLGCCISLFAARFIDLTELDKPLISVIPELSSPVFSLSGETSDCGGKDKINLIVEFLSYED